MPLYSDDDHRGQLGITFQPKWTLETGGQGNILWLPIGGAADLHRALAPWCKDSTNPLPCPCKEAALTKAGFRGRTFTPGS